MTPQFFMQEYYNNLSLKLLLFLINPLLGFIYSLRYPNSKSSFIIFCLFSLLFSWTMDYQGEYHDYARIVNSFYEINENCTTWWGEIKKYLFGQSDMTDIYLFSVFSIVSSFSQNYHFVFLIASIPFTCFILKSVRVFISSVSEFDLFFYISLLLFVLPYNLFYVEAPRFPTAVWISIYCTFKIICENQKSYWLLLVLTPLIHSSFSYYLLVFFIYYLVRRAPKVVIKLYYLSIPFVFIPVDFFFNLDYSFLPESITLQLDYYMSEESLQRWGMQAASGTGFYWVADLFSTFRRVVLLLGGHFLIRLNKKGLVPRKLNSLLIFYFLFVSVNNIINVIPVLGGRFFEMSSILFIYLWFMIARKTYYKNFIYLVFIANIYVLFYNNIFHNYSLVLDLDFLYGNAMYLILKNVI